MPIGTILPYGGIIGTENPLPAGWLVCDGTNYLITSYNKLFKAIKWSFKSQDAVQSETGDGENWFAVPDMRGRFPLGKDSMGSSAAANRVTNAAADTVGASSGQETRTIGISNLPEHEHDLINTAGEQFYAVTDAAAPNVDGNTDIVADLIGNATGATSKTSGGILTNTSLGQPLDVMNPFLTLNYIIYHGEE